MSMTLCRSCGKQFSKSATKCPVCGVQQNLSAADSSASNATSAWLPWLEHMLRTKNILIAFSIFALIVMGAGHLFHKYKESSGGEQLYQYYKSMDGNRDKPGFDEQEYVRGKLLSRCTVNGKPRGYYGWFEFRTVLLEGERVRDENPTRMYIFAVVDDEGRGSAIWRGEEYKQAVIENMQRTCD